MADAREQDSLGGRTMSCEFCVKCGAPNDNPRYHRAKWQCSWSDNNTQEEEHLHRYCRCGYDWTRETAYVSTIQNEVKP